MKVCLKCTDRHLGCHGECERYRLEKEKIEQAHRTRDAYLNSYGAMFNENRRQG